MIEWYWNGYLVQSALACFIYILANLSRIFLLKGLVHLFWFLLTPPIYRCLSECTSHGDKITAEKEALHRQSKTAELITQRMNGFVRTGYVYLLIGVALNLPWLAFLWTVKSNIEYTNA